VKAPLVLELGTRIGCGACGSLLAQSGAMVAFVEAGAGRENEGKFAHRPQFAAGKLSVDAADRGLPGRLVAAADAVLVSSDRDPAWVAALLPASGGPLVCDITAFGAEGPLAGRGFSDVHVQAMAGLMETTGHAGGMPRAVSAPILEFSTGLYAAAAVLAAWRTGGAGERIDMALYDCAVNALATFLPAHFGGGTPGRLGNGHSMAAPWNAYRAIDGWVLICSTGERHWQGVCTAMGQPELAAEPRYCTLGLRVERRGEVDAMLGRWTGTLSVADCVEALGRLGVACGPIVPVAGLADELNLRHRRTVRVVEAPGVGAVLLPAPLIGGAPDVTVPTPGAGRPELEAALAGRGVPSPSGAGGLPLKGLRVIEIGQFTTAPLCGRHLGMLGADVIKLEPPEGDAARLWAPHRDGLSYFFVLSNSGKRSIAVDLRSEAGAGFLHDLVASADVLLENMKPGSLARLGFPANRLGAINPRLVYCAVSGFGADSAYAERPAFDTVVQAMSGLMDLTQDGGAPLKSGISIADICGGELALVATLAALQRRDATGQGCALDLSMQDAATWLTQLSWSGRAGENTAETLACADGYVVTDGTTTPALRAEVAVLPRAEAVACLETAGLAAAPVQSIAEVVDHPQTVARRLIQRAGQAPWPLLASPLRYAKTPIRLGMPIGAARPWSPALASEILGAWSGADRAPALVS